MTLRDAQSVFFIGIGGSGMSGLAYLLAQNGKTVQGCDQNPYVKVPDSLTVVPDGETITAIDAAEVVVYSDAVKPDNTFRSYAESKGMTVLSYQQALGEFASAYTVLAVTGAHGKSSTSAFLAHILVEAGLDPTVLIGAPVIAWDRRGARAGKSEYMVVEADEYRNHFLELHPQVAIITTIDFDHPDFFSSLEDVQVSYKKFLDGMKTGGVVVTTDKEYEKQAPQFWPTSTKAVRDLVDVPVPGEHMQRNAALAVAAAEAVGVTREVAIKALSSFQGLGRRFEKVGELQGRPVFSDYGHHPSEIAATIQGIRGKFPEQKLLVIFEAHMIERVNAFFNEFISALSLADGVIICPVFYPIGREGERVNAEVKIHEALSPHRPARILEKYDDLASVLEEEIQKYDIACCFTAGVLDSKVRTIIK